jgi:hypothetical protein
VSAISLPAISSDASAVEAYAAFRDAGWREVGVGHWARVFADPSDTWAARVVPFDPAFRLFAEDCLNGAANRWLPRVTEIVPLRRDGFVTVMERLWPADEKRAEAFCAALGIRNESGYDEPAPQSLIDPNNADLVALRARLRALLAMGAARYKLWGGSDIRAGNVMADAGGNLKLVDAIFIAGKKICEALLEGRTDLLADFTRVQLEDFLSIAIFQPGGEASGVREDLLACVAKLYGG